MKEIHDDIKEFAEANEPLIKHKLQKGKAFSLIKMLTLTAAFSATLAMPILEDLPNNQKEPDNNDVPDVQEVIDNNENPAGNKEEDNETIELVPPAIASASATYQNESSTISIDLEINDAILENANITLDGEGYSQSASGGSIQLEINKKLSAGNHPISITIPYSLGEKEDTLTKELNIFVEPIEPVIDTAGASYNKDSDTITFFNTITINDATNYHTRAYLANGSGYNWYGMSDNGSLAISNYLENGSYSGFIEFSYQLLDEEKSIRKPFTVTIEKKEEEKQVVLPSFSIKEGEVYDSGDPPMMRYQIDGGVSPNGSGATDYEITSVRVNGQNTDLQEFYIDESGFGVFGEFSDDKTGKYKVTITISYMINGQSYSSSVSNTYEIVTESQFTGSFQSVEAGATPYPNNDHEAISVTGSFYFEFSGDYSTVESYLIVDGTPYQIFDLFSDASSFTYKGMVDDIPFDSAASNGPQVVYRLIVDGVIFNSDPISCTISY